jgi:hypothetical protein
MDGFRKLALKKKKKSFLNRTETKSVGIFAAEKTRDGGERKTESVVASIPVDGYENRYVCNIIKYVYIFTTRTYNITKP